jgi:hypothetical protein
VTPPSDRLDRIEFAIEKLTERHQALQSSLEHSAREFAERNREFEQRMEERHEALTMNLELNMRETERLIVLSQQDGEHIRILARNSQALQESIKSLENIALAHEQRRDDLESQQ